MSISSKLKKSKFLNVDGIWYPKNLEQVSYPTEGNSECYQIEDESFWFDHRNQVIELLFNKYVKTQDVIIDVGGGNGYVSYNLQNCGYHNIVLVEPGKVGCQNAKDRGLDLVVNATLEQVGFLKDEVDCAGVFDVVEHIETDVEFLRKLNWTLAPEGVLFITVPAFNLLWSNEDVKAGHYRRYTLKSITKALHEAGFKINYKSYFFSFLFAPILLKRVLGGKVKNNNVASNLSREAKSELTDHVTPTGLFGCILRIFCAIERYFIKREISMPIGSSIIIVAKKHR